MLNSIFHRFFIGNSTTCWQASLNIAERKCCATKTANNEAIKEIDPTVVFIFFQLRMNQSKGIFRRFVCTISSTVKGTVTNLPYIVRCVKSALCRGVYTILVAAGYYKFATIQR